MRASLARTRTSAATASSANATDTAVPSCNHPCVPGAATCSTANTIAVQTIAALAAASRIATAAWWVAATVTSPVAYRAVSTRLAIAVNAAASAPPATISATARRAGGLGTPINSTTIVTSSAASQLRDCAISATPTSATAPNIPTPARSAPSFLPLVSASASSGQAPTRR